jgi:hypothetical protein
MVYFYPATKPVQPTSAKPLRDVLESIIAPVLKAQGFVSRSVLQNWSEIVGARLATHTRPLKINWPRHRPAPGEAAEPASLVLRVEGAFALEAQQMSPLILERINTHLGWRCIGKLVLKQGPLPKTVATAPLAAFPDAPQHLQDATRHVDDPGLRAAMLRLGAAVAARKSRAVKT